MAIGSLRSSRGQNGDASSFGFGFGLGAGEGAGVESTWPDGFCWQGQALDKAANAKLLAD